MATPEANQAQIDYWNEQSGPKWVKQQAALDGFLESIGRTAMDRLDSLSGADAVDVGCGCGATTLALAERVGARGSVLGVDISAPMLARARERARDLPNVRFLQADAQTHGFDAATADALFSRFGVMFFADPTAAFANLRRPVRPGGALAFVCWQEIGKNPWCLLPLLAVGRHVQLPPPPAPGEPGPFAFGDAVRVRGILEGAGWTRVRLDPFETTLGLGTTGSLDDAVQFAMDVGPASRAHADVTSDVKSRGRDSIGEALAPFAGPDGVRLAGNCWIVTARNGD